jgi:peptide deformylase
MALRPVRTYPDPVLAEPTRPVEGIDDDLRTLVRDMAETMYAAPGIGLAANQVGDGRRVAVIDLGDPKVHAGLIVLINPEIVERDGAIVWEEGCLSLPGVYEEVDRAESVSVRALDLDGRERTIQARGLLAIAIQHELDHLDGVLLLDHLSSLKRSLLKRRLRKEALERQKEGAATAG